MFGWRGKAFAGSAQGGATVLLAQRDIFFLFTPINKGLILVWSNYTMKTAWKWSHSCSWFVAKVVFTERSTLPIAKLFNKTKLELNCSPLQHLLAFTLVIKSGRRLQKKIAHVRNRINKLPAWISFDNANYYFFSQSSESLLTTFTGSNSDLQNIQECFLIEISHLISNTIMLCWENR